jgi:ElaB/YqjD/DUF883 family membrane-anchored ribosome-binding protein
MAADFGDARERFEDRTTDQINKVKENITEMGHKASARMEEQRARAASALENTASSLHQKADTIPNAGTKIADFAHRTAGKLETTAGYLRDHDSKAMMRDCEELVRRYPGQFLAAGVFLGFFLGRSLRRSDY